MAPLERSFLRNNAFLVAAIALPLLVVAFFLLASAVPRWTVPPPAHDLLIRALGPYDQGRPRVSVEFDVRDGRVEAVVRPVPAIGYPQLTELFLFEHETMDVRRIPVDVPDLKEGDPPRRIVVDVLASRRVTTDPRAPDGYRAETRSQGGSGIVGELFGMGRYESALVIVNGGRVIRVPVPGREAYSYSAVPIGWVVEEGAP